MEDLMFDAGLVVVVLALPVLLQIILPLLILAGYCLANGVSLVLGSREAAAGLKKEALILEK